MPSMTRGIRNNNPLNIRIGNDWIGEVQNPDDPDYEQFTSMVYGLRAGFKILRRYIERYHRDTIAKIISSWAPPVENKTEVYTSTISQLTGISRDRVLSFQDEADMIAIVSAMCLYECGSRISESLIRCAYRMVRK